MAHPTGLLLAPSVAAFDDETSPDFLDPWTLAVRRGGDLDAPMLTSSLTVSDVA